MPYEHECFLNDMAIMERERFKLSQECATCAAVVEPDEHQPYWCCTECRDYTRPERTDNECWR